MFLILALFLVSYHSFNLSVEMSAGQMTSPVQCSFKSQRFWMSLRQLPSIVSSTELQLASMANQILTRLIWDYCSKSWVWFVLHLVHNSQWMRSEQLKKNLWMAILIADLKHNYCQYKLGVPKCSEWRLLFIGNSRIIAMPCHLSDPAHWEYSVQNSWIGLVDPDRRWKGLVCLFQLESMILLIRPGFHKEKFMLEAKIICNNRACKQINPSLPLLGVLLFGRKHPSYLCSFERQTKPIRPSYFFSG